MYGKKVSFFLVITLTVILGVTATNNQNSVEAFSPQVIQQGATGTDVIELQSRLQYLGFYNGKIDGVFGWGTYWALRNFQYEFGLEIDGIAGPEAKQKLADASEYDRNYVMEQIRKGNDFNTYGGAPKNNGKGNTNQGNKAQNQGNQAKKKGNQSQNQGNQAGNETAAEPTAVNVPKGFSQNEIQLMANAVYGEARGEPYVGQVAVASVILNRVESPTFPNTVSGVIFEPRAFTAVADGQIWLTPNKTSRRAVLDAINGWDPTLGSIYYFNPNTATSGWIWSRPQVKKIGQHIFAK
ncbi:spore cortex-lytic enzyme [Aquibacillus sp. 3ASR75-11]|uniref:Spore cortex-lytic enzyme n=1 Tax=Terrihalobacillus insolitus TaxID=2950438 RepID=A0A9X3WWR6_9BACI|nr:spore cortex-lytic enzyme [Terrihalobacillus insolitus]MDC3413072.1 spore cortex-lytic enzyme [Terrihalobacillus insolitus]MDC3424814.1 spore cortex-lytic enzyme [Terrihalobacillus insolitus]